MKTYTMEEYKKILIEKEEKVGGIVKTYIWRYICKQSKT